jgi:hypothetical protein
MTQPKSLEAIIDWNKANAIFAHLLETVSQHSQQLQKQSALLEQLVSGDEFGSVCEKLGDRLQSIELRLSSLEAATKVEGGGTIGHRVALNEQGLRSALTSLGSKADANALADVSRTFDDVLESQMRAMKRWGADRSTMERLGEAQVGLTEGLRALQMMLATKLDRSEVDHLQSLLQKCGSIADVIDNSELRLVTLERELRGSSAEQQRLAQDISKIEEALLEKASTFNLTHLRGEIMASQEHRSDEAQANLQKLSKSLHLLRADNASRFIGLEGRIAECASKDEMNSKADSKACDEMWAELREELDKKAWSSLVEDLTRAQSSTAKEASLAVRFIEWYSQRGEALEHNLHAVEKKIEGLAIDSLPGRRTPYDGRVRFTAEGLRAAAPMMR